ncbi:MAG: pullulanase [Alteromonadaceae bacterium]|nr:pullulanase [Alteromonadaceae bacterium]
MFTRTNSLPLLAISISFLSLSGCGGSGSESGTTLLTCSIPNVPDATGTSCVAPEPISCAPPTVPDALNESCVVGADPTAPAPVASPAMDQAVLYFNLAAKGADNSANDETYTGYRLHTWNNDACDAYADADTDWANGREHTGIDPNYGAYWVLELKPDYAGTLGACGNFIIHVGTDDAGKELGGGDFTMPLSQDDPDFARMNFTFTDVASIFEFPIVSLGPQPVKIDGAAAHWIDSNTLIWDIDPTAVSQVKLHYSANADLSVDVDTGLSGTAIELEEIELSDEQKARVPHLANMLAFEGDWSSDEAKEVLKTQAVLASYDADGVLNGATQIQLANAIDSLYTQGENDADEASLGAVYTDGGIQVNLWAPTAQSVSLKLFNDAKVETASYPMELDSNSGVWRYEGGVELDRQLYRFEVTAYHPVTMLLETMLTTDPYSLSLSTNSRFSQFVNLNDEDLKPEGWETHVIPTITNPEDAVIYEGHIRDFSVRDESTSAQHRGKYLAFTEQGSVPNQHLAKLVENGLTHFHVLPANDMATVEEDESQSVDLTSTVADLCRLNRQAAVCDEENADASLQSVFDSYDAIAEPQKAQALTEQMRGDDRFNWGYDPYHFNVPEGSYATDADGVTRIKEMRAMNQSLHEMGMRVALDVVYNHTNASGLNGKSVLDKVVPGYYHRYDTVTGGIVRETCCDDTEPRNRMMEKFMQDSLVMWATQYKFDSFRFDIMSQATKDTMLRLESAVKAVDEDNYFYGEGWIKEDRGYEQATQINMAGTQIGTYNDRIREAVRQGQIFSTEPSDSALAAQDNVKMSLAGTLTDYILEDYKGTASATSNIGGYATDPADIINYVSKHDNETLWDQLQYTLPNDMTLAERVRAQNIAATLPLMSQGIPFFQLGGDFLRSKSMDRNTYDAGDWFNYVDFTMNSNNWLVGLPLAQDNEGRWAEMANFIYSPERAASMTEIEFASNVFNELLKIRSSSALFRLTTANDIIDRIGFHNIGARQTQGLIVMSIDDGIAADNGEAGENQTQRADIDPMADALVVIVNSSSEQQTHGVPTAQGFELHSVLMNSVDTQVRGASFAQGEGDNEGKGMFTVPALTTAVFVKPQMGAQGVGLSAYATSGAPDVVPYGSTSVFVRGAMNGWGEVDEIAYQGDGVYAAVISIEPGDYEFKVASADWSTVDFGANNGDESVALGADKTLIAGGANLQLSLSQARVLKFTLEASDKSAPVLTVDNEEPFFGTTVFVRGSLNGWGEDDPMDYAIGGQYSRTIEVTAGSYEFKVASADWSTVDFGSADADVNVTVGQGKALAPGGSNMTVTFNDDGKYTFVFDANDKAAPTLSIFDAEMFGENTVFIRGGMNGWGEVDALVFNADGSYTVDIAVDAGSYEFKIATGDWSTIDLGGVGDDTQVVVGEAKQLTYAGANLMIDIPTSATYRFSVVGPDPSAPTVTVTQL